MGALRFLFIMAVIMALPHHVLGDIIVTTDDMTLNGKIIEDKKGTHVIIGNYHGTFTIQYSQIREKHETDDYRDDLKIFRRMGKNVDEAEIKTNYQAGVKKLEEKKTAETAGKPASTKCLLIGSPYFLFNLGRIQQALPYGYGTSLVGEFRFTGGYWFLPAGIRINAEYYRSENKSKKISAFRGGLGPAWIFPFKAGNSHFNLALSPAFGGGHYTVNGRDEKSRGLKWNISASLGMEFLISSWVISPQVRFDYIYDRVMPVYGLGIALGAGYCFNI